MRTIRGMGSATVLLVAIAAGCARVPARPAVADAPAKDVKLVVEGNNAFAVDLYHKLRAREGNLFLSPYSISTALAMTYAGARGETAAEMRKVLHFALPDERLHAAFATLAYDLRPEGCELNIANRLWGGAGERFLDSFLELTEDYYGARLEQVDFAGATEAARKTINAWVEKQTRDKIKELLHRGDVDGAILVLTNAIYFKGDWASQFKEEATRDASFTLLDGATVQVPMMGQTADFRHARRDGLEVLELPYVGEELSMFVLLPDTHDGLPQLEEALTAVEMSGWLSDLRKVEMAVFLPRFKTTCRFNLGDELVAMGMPLAFGGADFSGMNGGKDLFISRVIHQAFVDMNEKGTEAAAATAVIMRKGLPPEFRADHPFLFLIRDNRSGSILFFGRAMNPLG